MAATDAVMGVIIIMASSIKGYANASMYAVKWRHYTKSSRTMVNINQGETKDEKITRLLKEFNKIK